MAMDVRFLGSNPILAERTRHAPGGEQRYYDRHAPRPLRPVGEVGRLAGLIAAVCPRVLLPGGGPRANAAPATRRAM